MHRRDFLKYLGVLPATYYFDVGKNLWRAPELVYEARYGGYVEIFEPPNITAEMLNKVIRDVEAGEERPNIIVASWSQYKLLEEYNHLP